MARPVFIHLLLLVSSMTSAHLVKKRMLLTPSEDITSTTSKSVMDNNETMTTKNIRDVTPDPEEFRKMVETGKTYLSSEAKSMLNEILKNMEPALNITGLKWHQREPVELQILAAVAELFSPNWKHQIYEGEPSESKDRINRYSDDFFAFVEIGRAMLNEKTKVQLQKMIDVNHISTNLTKEEALRATDVDVFRVIGALGNMFFGKPRAIKIVEKIVTKTKKLFITFPRVSKFEEEYDEIEEKEQSSKTKTTPSTLTVPSTTEMKPSSRTTLSTPQTTAEMKTSTTVDHTEDSATVTPIP